MVPVALMVLGQAVGWSCRRTVLGMQKGEQIVIVLIWFGSLGQNHQKTHLFSQLHCHHSVTRLLSPGQEVRRSQVVLALNGVISKLVFVYLGVQFGAAAVKLGAYGLWPAQGGALLPSWLLQLVLTRQSLLLPCAKLKFLLTL